MLKVESNFTPRGDQPKAIAQLVDGIESGYRFQTLLGATGTGKSVAWDEPITVQMEEGKIFRGSIGELIDGVFGRTQQLFGEPQQQEFDTPQQEEHLELPPPGAWQVLAWDATTGKTDWQTITALSRHKSPNNLHELKTACGRKVSVTNDHSVYVLRDGAVQLLHGDAVRAGDALPIPRFIPEPKNLMTQINLLDYARDTLGVDVRPWMNNQGFTQTIAAHYNLQTKISAMRTGARGHRVRVEVARELVAQAHIPLHKLQVSGKTYSAPPLLPITPALMTVLGQYIAEGHAAERYALISVREKAVQQKLETCLRELNASFFRRQDGDFVLGTRLWRDLLFHTMGGLAANKRLPNFWPSLSNAHLASMLSAYFEGDGGMDGGAITAVSLSTELMFDLAEALLRFGIWARVRKIFKRKPNQEMGTYWRLSISGASNLELFNQQIGFITERKNSLLAASLKTGNTNVDLIYGVGKRLLEERLQRGFNQKELAGHVGCRRSTISAIELGKRNPSVQLFTKLCAALDLKDPAFTGLANVFWSPVTSNTTTARGWPCVYDFSVEGFETFLTGRGGLFVHNTYSVAKTIEAIQRPALIIAPNKILTAQLASEFKEFFPSAAVEFFVSYYDYYQPEAYVPGRDLFIEKEATINQEIERLRHSTTRSLLTRKDVIVVASVSCIYGLGNPEEYKKMNLFLENGANIGRDAILDKLVQSQYERNDVELLPGRFRAKGEVVEIWPSYDERPMRVELWGDAIERIQIYNQVTGEAIETLPSTIIYPAKHYVTEAGNIEAAIAGIETELKERLEYFESVGKLLEAQRIKERTLYDLEMMRVLGYCSGIENYSRHIDGREPGSKPYTLMDYFPSDFVTFLDESHVTHSQIGGMYKGDYSRKKTLADYGFRLPSCMDNRPLKNEEFYDMVGQMIYVSATPGPHEREVSSQITDQVIRPTGLLDPRVEVRPTKGQVEDLLGAIRKRAERDERVLVTTLTKRMSEDLTEYFVSHGIKARYMHSEIDALERQEIIRDLRLGHFDVLVGINLLREGLDLPEVSLVAILDADKPGFLRSERSLIQTIGRAARNVNGEVYLYGDAMTPAMQYAIGETNRRRALQEAFNKEHNITPTTVSKSIRNVIRGEEPSPEAELPEIENDRESILARITDLELDMWQASEDTDFEKAAQLRDEIRQLETKLSGQKVNVVQMPGKQKGRARGKKKL